MTSKTNVIVILADDMGYGDVTALNRESKIPTPHLDAMAANGISFRNAHAMSAVCTPSRYGLLTGRYCWRSRLKSGIVWDWDSSLIEKGRTTLASLLKRQGYATACIGKWHLGWDWKDRDGQYIGASLPFGCRDNQRRLEVADRLDLGQRIEGGPTDHGFDSYFGVDVPNFPPYAWFENDRLVEVPTTQKPEEMYGHPGPAVADWRLEDMLPEFAKRAVKYIEDAAGNDEPFFLYLPLTSPHSPVVPNCPFKGKSGAGNYGDFVMETDWVVGQVREALQRSGIADNTLLLFTSDNGPERQVGDPEDCGAYERIQQYNHSSMGEWRGIKRDVWEGGHRVPFLIEWPQSVASSVSCDQLVTLGDVFATVSEITADRLADNEGEDSVSFLSLLQGADKPTRTEAVYHSQHGIFAISQDNWVFIDSPCGGENTEPDWYQNRRGYVQHGMEKELYNLADDPSERRNLYQEEPSKASELKALLTSIQGAEHLPYNGEDGDLPA